MTATAFLIADLPGLTAICERDAISEPYVLKASNLDPDTLSYVDDAGSISSKQKQDVDKMIEWLRKQGFELRHEGSFSEVLGIKFEKNPNGSVIQYDPKGPDQ